MSSRAFVDTVVEAVNRRDFDALVPLVDPQLEFHSVFARAEGSHFLGVDGLRQWATTVDDTWQDFRVGVAGFRAGTQGRALVLLRTTGTARASGVPLDAINAQVWHWRDGRLWRNVAYSDHDEALRAAGLT